MKSTKIMLAIIATFLSTWCVLGLIGWFISDLSYKECLTHISTFFCMLCFGWIPSLMVGSDVDEYLSNKQ